MLEWGGIKRDITFLVISGIALAASLMHIRPAGIDPAWAAIILCGIPIILEAVIGLVTAFDIKADVLVSMALIASRHYRRDLCRRGSGFYHAAGALLEDLTVAKARAGIEKLVHLTPRTARKVSGQFGDSDRCQRRADRRYSPGPSGRNDPVDGVILSGQTSVNQAVMTGESLPVDKTVGDEVSSGTVNQFGAFDMKASE